MPVQIVPDPSSWVNKMIDRVSGAGQAWEDGIKNPKASPTAAMRAANGKYKANMQKALTEDRWAKKVATLTDDQIAASALAAGGSRFVQGVTSRKDKILAAVTRLQGRLVPHVQKIRNMPQDTDQQREQRMIENLRGMRAMKGA